MQRLQVKTFQPVIFLALALIEFLNGVLTNECVVVSNSELRAFPKLLDLQANKVSFKADDPKFSGNYVTIQENIEDLGHNSFICFTSKYITKILLSNRKLKMIEDGAFISLECLMTLDLSNNSISDIKRETFEGMPILHELNLAFNNIRDIPEHAFSMIPLLKVLNITGNSIAVLHRESFHNLTMLEKLDLSRNHIRQFVPDVLRYFTRLSNLYLDSNNIDRIEFEKWNLPVLRSLNLANNVLESFDTSYDYYFGATLSELYLDHNYLTRLNPYGLRKNLLNLTFIDLNSNPWSCTQLPLLITTLKDARISFKGLSLDGGPNVEGIACNRSMEIYTKDKVHDVDDASKVPILDTKTNTTTNVELQQTIQKIISSNQKVERYINNINILIVVFFTILVIFIVIDICVRSNLLCFSVKLVNRLRSDRNAEHIENVNLIRDRL